MEGLFLLAWLGSFHDDAIKKSCPSEISLGPPPPPPAPPPSPPPPRDTHDREGKTKLFKLINWMGGTGGEGQCLPLISLQDPTNIASVNLVMDCSKVFFSTIVTPALVY